MINVAILKLEERHMVLRRGRKEGCDILTVASGTLRTLFYSAAYSSGGGPLGFTAPQNVPPTRPLEECKWPAPRAGRLAAGRRQASAVDYDVVKPGDETSGRAQRRPLALTYDRHRPGGI